MAADPQPSPQDLYSHAQAAFDKGDWDTAIDGFNKALAAMNAGPTSRSRAAINARLASALVNRGRFGEAQQAAAAAIDGLSSIRPAPADELTSAYLTLGDAQRYDLQFRTAAESYRKATAFAGSKGGADDFNAQLGLVLSTMVIDPTAAAATADALLNNKALVATLSPAQLAEVESLKGRAELNLGHADDALTFVERAVEHSGGLTSRVSLAQVSIRGDAALVQLKLRHDDKARELLAYSGAGHLPDEDWISSGRTELPQCGGPLDITPQDTAVIEFAIADDGRVSGAAPIYVSRPGDMGVAFAEAVRRWRWEPATIAKVNPFWRASIRLQLRCNVRLAAMSDRFFDATRQWLSDRGATDIDLGRVTNESQAVASPLSLADGEATDISSGLHALEFGRLGEPKRTELSAQVESLLTKNQAPPEVMATFYYLKAQTDIGRSRFHAREEARRLSDVIPHMSPDPSSARAVAWLRTEMAVQLEEGGDFERARPILAEVVALPDSQLTDDDVVRSVATVHLAVVKARLDKASGVQLTAAPPPDRCSTLNVRPVATNMAISSSAFPAEAMRWRFEGYVREAFDIDRDGKVEGVRTVMAYPPFVFDEATEGAVARFRYLPPIDADGVFVGCTNQTVNVKYVIPKS